MLCEPTEYLKRLSAVPPLEKIRKANLPRLFEECWDLSKATQNCLKEPFASSLTKALGIDKQRLHRLRQENGGWVFLSWLQYEKEQNTLFSDEVLNWFSINKVTRQMVDFVLEKMSPIQIRNYVLRQMSGSKDSVSQVIYTWRDYLSMAKSFGMNTDDEIVFRVNKLRLRHKQLILRGKMANGVNQAAEVAPSIPLLTKSARPYPSMPTREMPMPLSRLKTCRRFLQMALCSTTAYSAVRSIGIELKATKPIFCSSADAQIRTFPTTLWK